MNVTLKEKYGLYINGEWRMPLTAEHLPPQIPQRVLCRGHKRRR